MLARFSNLEFRYSNNFFAILYDTAITLFSYYMTIATANITFI